ARRHARDGRRRPPRRGTGWPRGGRWRWRRARRAEQEQLATARRLGVRRHGRHARLRGRHARRHARLRGRDGRRVGRQIRAVGRGGWGGNGGGRGRGRGVRRGGGGGLGGWGVRDARGFGGGGGGPGGIGGEGPATMSPDTKLIPHERTEFVILFVWREPTPS